MKQAWEKKPSKRARMRWMMIVFRVENIFIQSGLPEIQTKFIEEVQKRKFYPELVNDAIRAVEKSNRPLPSAKEIKLLTEVLDPQSLVGAWW